MNRSLATLRRLLRLVREWRVIERVPCIHLLAGERNRDFILSRTEEGLYLEMAPQPLKDIAMLILDAGLRMVEILALEWPKFILNPPPVRGSVACTSEMESHVLPGATCL